MKRIIWFILIVALFCAVLLFTACSQDKSNSSITPVSGNLDTSFGIDGKVVTGMGIIGSSVNSVAIQTYGKIVVAGYSSSSSGLTDFTLARYNNDGSLDTGFGTNGRVATDFSTNLDSANAITTQADGKIVAVGYASTSSGYTDFALARYNTDGTLDISFGINGKVTTDFGTSYDSAYAVAIQTDGKIVAAGEGIQMSLARYNTDGSLDTSFGTNGKVVTDFGLSGSTAYAVAIQTDGKIVAAGSGIGFSLVRYNTNGSLDTSFGTNGKVTADTGDQFYTVASAVVIQSDGKIVAAGSALFNTGLPYAGGYSYTAAPGFVYFALARYNTDGSFDASFGTGGKVATAFGPVPMIDRANAIAIQSDGKIVVVGGVWPVGYSYTPINADFAIARYNTDGILDTNFGSNGKVTTDFGTFSDVAYGVAIQTDGMIVTGGVSSSSFALARYLP